MTAPGQKALREMKVECSRYFERSLIAGKYVNAYSQLFHRGRVVSNVTGELQGTNNYRRTEHLRSLRGPERGALNRLEYAKFRINLLDRVLHRQRRDGRARH